MRLPDDRLLHAMINAYWNPLEFDIPVALGESGLWRRLVDTLLESPDDIHEPADAPVVSGSTYAVQPRSLALLITSAAVAATETR